ncbi:MAG: hypothetical protein ACXADY_13380 [Candidatus Hodarchaeales archaeon]
MQLQFNNNFTLGIGTQAKFTLTYGNNIKSYFDLNDFLVQRNKIIVLFINNKQLKLMSFQFYEDFAPVMIKISSH